MLTVLRQLPLASAAGIAGALGRPVAAVLHDLSRLRDRGLVDSLRPELAQVWRQRCYLTGAPWRDEEKQGPGAPARIRPGDQR